MKHLLKSLLALSLLAIVNITYSQNTVVLHVPKALEVNAGSDTTIAQGAAVNIGGSPTAQYGVSPYQYQWTPGGYSSSNPTVNPSITTEYLVYVTDANGCTISHTVVISISTIGVDKIADGCNITVSPNPSSGLLNIHFEKLLGTAKLSVLDVNGKIVVAKELHLSDNQNHTVNLEKFSAGQYILSVSGDGFSISRSIIKK